MKITYQVFYLSSNNIVLDKVILNNNSSVYDKVFTTLSSKFSPEKLKLYINQKDIEGNTPLLYASYRGNLRMVQSLIDNGADINVASLKGLNVLHMAAQGDSPNMLIYFKDKYGLDIYSKDNNGNTPLHWACYTCAENSINYLLSFMDDVNVQDNKGQTPLHIAIFTERIKIIKKLLHKGSDLTLKDSHGKNAIDLAKELTGSSSKITSILISQKHVKKCIYGSDSQGCCFSNPFTFILLFLLYTFVIYIFELSYLPKYYTSLCVFLFLCLCIGFVIVNISDPGRIKKNNNKEWLSIVEADTNVKMLCPYCKVKKQKLSKHCFRCGDCVKDRDHHCNLLGNCIARGNWTYYLIFLAFFIAFVAFTYYISLKVFLIKETTINNKSIILPFYFLYRKTIKDLVSVLVMTFGIFFFGMGVFLFFKQMRQIVIMNKIKQD